MVRPVQSTTTTSYVGTQHRKVADCAKRTNATRNGSVAAGSWEGNLLARGSTGTCIWRVRTAAVESSEDRGAIIKLNDIGNASTAMSFVSITEPEWMGNTTERMSERKHYCRMQWSGIPTCCCRCLLNCLKLCRVELSVENGRYNDSLRAIWWLKHTIYWIAWFYYVERSKIIIHFQWHNDTVAVHKLRRVIFGHLRPPISLGDFGQYKHSKVCIWKVNSPTLIKLPPSIFRVPSELT